MKKIMPIVLVIAMAFTVTSCKMKKEENKIEVQYPETKKSDVKDNYFGTEVADPYRWLEDDRSPETEAWVRAENAVTFDYLSKIPFRDKIRERIAELWNYPRRSAPYKDGGKYFFYSNNGLQNQSVLMMQESLDSEPEVLIDPNQWSADGTVTLSGFNVSKDGKFAVYGVSRSGSDWVDLQVMDLESRKDVGDTLKWIKFGGGQWFGHGFFYSRYPEPEEGSEFSSQNRNQKVYYHRIGDDQSEDKLIFEDPAHPLRYKFAGVSDDERFLILTQAEGTSGNSLMLKDLEKGLDAPFIPIVSDFENDHSVIDNNGSTLYIYTNLNAPNYRLVKVDAARPTPENWVDVIPNQEKAVLTNVRLAGNDRLVVQYMQDASDHLYIYDTEGKRLNEIELPTVGSVGGISANKEDDFIFYSFTSYTYPTTIYKYDLQTGETEVFFKPEVKFDPTEYETKQVFYPSKDGTMIPMFITMKKGLKRDGNNPALLYGYGGFNISLTPGFNPANLVFLEAGGIYCVANLRGGGEYGEAWHEAGMKENKQNVFDDFIAAAEYLIREKYTRPEKLAIRGGSNGGLLVGAVMTQRPDLFAVALPAVGVMDMLRFHKFTVGHGWVVEYGSSDSAEQFEYLYKYSPLHNIREGVSYPATLITTGDHDDRVVPAHSFKFAATLQEKQAGDKPVLIRIETKAGHGGGKPINMIIDEYADIWAFVFYNLGMQY